MLAPDVSLLPELRQAQENRDLSLLHQLISAVFVSVT
jgi:hypothetical protein